MSALDRRLSAIEARLGIKPEVFLGSFEMHYTKAWPDCEGDPDCNLERCDEHGPRCGKSVTPLRRPEHRSIVFSGRFAPLD